MTTHFFTGGTMMSADLLKYFQRELTIEKKWWVNGKHYSKTCEVRHILNSVLPDCHRLSHFLTRPQQWITTMLSHKKEIWPHLIETYGEQNASTWWYRWQIFYLACSSCSTLREAIRGVAHLLFVKDKVIEGEP